MHKVKKKVKNSYKLGRYVSQNTKGFRNVVIYYEKKYITYIRATTVFLL